MTAAERRAQTVPTIAEVEAICAIVDPVVRNLRITQAYGELSGEFAGLTGSGANWCTFSTWASKQAGQTIRQEDLARRVEDELGRSEAVGVAIARIGEFLRSIGQAADAHRIARAVREACGPARALARTSDAVARGNLKVFAEIGREFARFLALLGEGGLREPGAIDRFCAGLRPGDPPDGQGLLRAAFTDYGLALSATDLKVKAECLLLANLRISVHEQTRLQPEIAEALDAPVQDPVELRERLLERLLADVPWLTWIRVRLARWRGRSGPLDEASRRLADELRRCVRAAVTEELMTLTLPGETLRLGRDVTGAFPEPLRRLANPDLLALLGTIDPTPNTTHDSAARDWASLPQRLHFVADLFRTRQEDPSLLGPPFSGEQIRAIKAGRRPDGRL